MEKKVAIILGIIVAVFLLMVITKGKIAPFLFVGVIGYAVYKNNM